MKYSLKWLGEHIDAPLPSTEELVRDITIKSFEVEAVESLQGDHLLDIKVLPDRAHDALSHRGMAREVAGLFGIPRKERVLSSVKTDASVSKVRVTIDDAKLCPRYIGVRVDGVKIGASPETLSTKISLLGGRSISNIVDLTNFVLFDIGQPMHAFDAGKVAGGITVRLAKAGETMTTLDNKDLVLDGTELVIADDEAVLALAGIKGGKKAEVDEKTTSIIFESANFDPIITRRTSTKHGIKTDASKRYENGITSEYAGKGMRLVLSELAKIQPSARIGATVDVYPVPEKGGYHMKISTSDINRLLGGAMVAENVEEVLSRLGFEHKKDGEDFVVTIPNERLDLRISQDLIEEIGRHYGYDKIEPALPKFDRKGIPNKRLYYANKVRKFLVSQGYSEVFTYSFAVKEEGEVEVQNPVGKDRPYMRRDLMSGIFRALQSNFFNAPIIGIDEVKTFEFGNVFLQEGERFHLSVGVHALGKKKIAKAKEDITALKLGIAQLLQVPNLENAGKTQGVSQVHVMSSNPQSLLHRLHGSEGDFFELDFDALIKEFPEPTVYEEFVREKNDIHYKTLSPYPFIVRDIAIFVPQEVTEEYIETLLKKEAGDLVVRFSQFDKFQKPGESRVSYAYRMVFQSYERTLTDEEINLIMERVTAKCNAEIDWQVR